MKGQKAHPFLAHDEEQLYLISYPEKILIPPVDVVKNIYALYACKKITEIISLCHPDVYWVVDGPPEHDQYQTFFGKEGVRDFFAITEKACIEMYKLKPREFVTRGRRVVVFGQASGVDHKNSARFFTRWVHIFEIMDGMIALFRSFLCHAYSRSNAVDNPWRQG